MSRITHKERHAVFGGLWDYISELRGLALGPLNWSDWENRCLAALNGGASSELRRVVPIEVRRKFGAFFTGTDLSERLLDRCVVSGDNSVFYDPSCGMGDLLLAAAKRLPLANTLKQTLRIWGSQITGTDLHREFVEGAKARLALLARKRHGTGRLADSDWNNCFPYLRVADGLSEQGAYQRATIVLMNPPFGVVSTPKGCKWAGGRITESATFVVTALERVKPGTEVRAILPDVLRSGSFSRHWRNRVSELAEVRSVNPGGIFDHTADVDVFLLNLVRRQTNNDQKGSSWLQPAREVRTTIADFFDVHVGRVVPHRDKRTGQPYTYIHPRCVPTWTVMTDFTETRRCERRAYKPPFVVIRRTSRPGDLYRATATVVCGRRAVAVENHLIVCQPRDGKLATCKELMRQLKSEDVNEYLNLRIRCRHLTVGAVGTIPFRPK